MSGGSAMYHGANYQAAVATFFGTLALAENTNLIPTEIPPTAPPVRIGAEQGWPVDDLAIWFGTTSMTWIQAKASLDASESGRTACRSSNQTRMRERSKISIPLKARRH